jgi:hypothetical protein
MNKQTKILIVLFLVAVKIFIVFWFNQNKPDFITNIASNSEISETVSLDGKYCFSRLQEATSDAPYRVEEYVTLDIKGENVSGIKRGFQSGPGMTNGYEGSLSGEISGDEMNLVFSFVIEGSEGKELELYKISENELQKYRHVLKEENSMLVPDLDTPVTVISYHVAVCD